MPTTFEMDRIGVWPPGQSGRLPFGPWWPRFLAGKYGSALDLDGAAQYAMLPAGLLASVTNFTNGAGAEQILEAAALPPGQWKHVAITRDGNTCRLYRNGVLAASGGVTITPASFNPALNYLGESQYAADPLFGGRLDELFIYNYALSGNEIARLAANEPPVLGGLQIPGDGNQDSSLDISDAVRLLGFLFGASYPPALGTACILIEGCQDRCTP